MLQKEQVPAAVRQYLGHLAPAEFHDLARMYSTDSLLSADAEDPPAEEETEDPRAKRAKYITIPFVFVLTMGASLMPWAVSTLREALPILSISCCISAGVILGGAFSHILPEANEAWNHYFELAGPGRLVSESDVEYPFASLLSIGTLLFLFSVDVLLVRDSHFNSNGGHSHVLPPAAISFEEGRGGGRGAGAAAGAGVVVGGAAPSSSSPKNGSTANQLAAASADEATPLQSARGSTEQVASAWLFFFALSFHSIFDGLSVGAEKDYNKLGALLAAVLSHKALDGLAVGLPIFMANWPVWHSLLALAFCAGMTPLGISLGMAVSDGYEGANGQLSKAIILSISGGSYIFISLIELLPAGFGEKSWKKVKLAGLICAWGVMALIARWV